MFDDSCWAIRNLEFETKCHLKVVTPYMLTKGGVPWPQTGTPALKNKQKGVDISVKMQGVKVQIFVLFYFPSLHKGLV